MIPDSSLCDDTGNVKNEVIWAALDCPGAWAIVLEQMRFMLLGRLVAQIEERMKPGEKCIVIAWKISSEGRKIYAGSAVFSENGQLYAKAKATWIELKSSDQYRISIKYFIQSSKMISKNKQQILIPVFVFFLLYFVTSSLAAQFKVIRVYNGDTLIAESQGYEITIRFVGIDAPETSKKKNEPGQPFSQRAKIHLQKLVLDKMVDIESYGLDRYSRVLAVVYVDGINVNLEMVKEGLAEVYKGKPAPGFDNQPYWDAEQEARKNKRGMWSLGDKYISPREWRKTH